MTTIVGVLSVPNDLHSSSCPLVTESKRTLSKEKNLSMTSLRNGTYLFRVHDNNHRRIARTLIQKRGEQKFEFQNVDSTMKMSLHRRITGTGASVKQRRG